MRRLKYKNWDFLEIQNRILLTFLIEICILLVYTGITTIIPEEETGNSEVINFCNFSGAIFLFLLVNFLFLIRSRPIKENISRFTFLIVLELAHYLYFMVYIPWDEGIEEEILKTSFIYLTGKKIFLPILVILLFYNLKIIPCDTTNQT